MLFRSLFFFVVVVVFPFFFSIAEDCTLLCVRYKEPRCVCLSRHIFEHLAAHLLLLLLLCLFFLLLFYCFSCFYICVRCIPNLLVIVLVYLFFTVSRFSFCCCCCFFHPSVNMYICVSSTHVFLRAQLASFVIFCCFFFFFLLLPGWASSVSMPDLFFRTPSI